MLVCANCARLVVFERDGWIHLTDGGCDSLVVAWPPPVEDEDDAESDAA